MQAPGLRTTLIYEPLFHLRIGDANTIILKLLRFCDDAQWAPFVRFSMISNTEGQSRKELSREREKSKDRIAEGKVLESQELLIDYLIAF